MAATGGSESQNFTSGPWRTWPFVGSADGFCVGREDGVSVTEAVSVILDGVGAGDVVIVLSSVIRFSTTTVLVTVGPSKKIVRVTSGPGIILVAVTVGWGRNTVGPGILTISVETCGGTSTVIVSMGKETSADAEDDPPESMKSGVINIIMIITENKTTNLFTP